MRWKNTFDQWITSSKLLEIKDQYVVFFPLEGEQAGKNITYLYRIFKIIREL